MSLGYPSDKGSTALKHLHTFFYELLPNPNNAAVIPRNHRVEAAINAAVQQGDFAPMETLLTVLSTPFDLKPEHVTYSTPPTPSERVSLTFCGT